MAQRMLVYICSGVYLKENETSVVIITNIGYEKCFKGFIILAFTHIFSFCSGVAFSQQAQELQLYLGELFYHLK